MGAAHAPRDRSPRGRRSMTRRRRCNWLGLPLLGVLGAVGCGGPHMIDVQGTVTLNGKPIHNVQVEFLPDPEQGTHGPRSEGVTDQEGRFLLTCDNGRTGAVPGTHRVLVTDLARWEDISL